MKHTRYGVYFVDILPQFSSPVIIYVISYKLRPRFKDTRVYLGA